jgi:Zn-dependent protease
MSLITLLLKFLMEGAFLKFLFSLGSIFVSIVVYATTMGLPFAAGFVGLIFIHEMGHYLAARRKQLNVGLPTFIPFVGAWIALKEQPMNAEVEAYVAYAGPLMGTFAAFALYYLGRHTGNNLYLALAQAGFFINLFNLIPISPLDGGRITAILTPRIWFLGVPLLMGLWYYSPSPVMILIAVLAIPQLIKAWKFDPHSEENKRYYDIKEGARFEYSVLYLGLVVVLALMIQAQV